jgi:hypothetical protein
MNQEIKNILENFFNNEIERDFLLDITFNTNNLWYEEPENFESYLQLVENKKEIFFNKIIKIMLAIN